jgi:sulfopropanediol 3-dehydrogenase
MYQNVQSVPLRFPGACLAGDLPFKQTRLGSHIRTRTRTCMPDYLKTAARHPNPSDPEVSRLVSEILLDVERNGERAVRKYAERFDGYAPERFTVTDRELQRCEDAVSDELRGHIEFAAKQIETFAKAQRATLTDLELETLPGVVLGHRHVPVQSVGAYSPGGRYPLIASSLMTTVVPIAAGVERVVACAPPYRRGPIHPAMLYAMRIGGAHNVVTIGGAHGLAALAFGIEDIEPTDMIVGAGNAYVAEAKRQLFGRVGIDLLAGPTEILVITDHSGDAELIAADLVGQLEHGPTSVGWLVSTSRDVAEEVLERVTRRIASLPTASVAADAWEAFGAVIVCDDDAEALVMADRLAAEHVEVHTEEPDWYLDHLHNYGSLFLGSQTTVPYGDKGIGTNHVLPTAGAARYTGGLWVGKFLKTLTYQRANEQGTAAIAPTIVAISEAEELPGHALSASERLRRLQRI